MGRGVNRPYRTKVVQKMIDAIDNDKPLPIFSIIGALKMLILACDHVSATTVQDCFKKPGFSDDEKDGDSDNPFSTFKHFIKQLRSRDETLVPDYVTCDDILAFDDEVAVTGNSN